MFRNEKGHRVPDTTFLKQHFIREGRLREEQALEIVERMTTVLSREPNLVQVKSPVTSELRYRLSLAVALSIML